jgi:uncharacterized protein (TIGR00369 family)
MSEISQLNNDDGCFACGKSNPIGLHLEFEQEDGEYVTYFTPAKEHQGWLGITHGGIVCTVLDEVMARAVYELGCNAVTAEMTVRMKRPAPTGARLRFAGRIESENHRIIDCSARATDEDGHLIAEATGRMMRVKYNRQ